MQRVIDAANRSNFAQNVAKGLTATKRLHFRRLQRARRPAKRGQNAKKCSRMLRNAKVNARIRELLPAATIEASMREVNARVAAQQDRWERMQRVIDERCAGPRPPGGARAARRGYWCARCGSAGRCGRAGADVRAAGRAREEAGAAGADRRRFLWRRAVPGSTKSNACSGSSPTE